MTRVLHLFDADADWEQRVAVAQLLERAPADRAAQTLASLDLRVPASEWFDGRRIVRTPVRLGAAATAAPALRRLIDAQRIDVIHACGMAAATAATAAAGTTARDARRAVVVTRFDPRITAGEAKRLRVMASGPRFAVSCSSGTVRRRLIENGVPADRCVVVRPGVSFARINQARRDPRLRTRLGLLPEHRVLIAAHPVVRNSGHDRIVWSAHLCHYLDPSWRMILYGRSPLCRRLRRLSGELLFPGAVVWPGQACRYEDLISVADVLVTIPAHDVSTTAIAWAMAASVPVVGSAVHSVAELIAHKHNGLLIQPRRGPAASVAVASMLARLDTLAPALTEVARGQAYQVFSVRRFVDQQWRLYDNLHHGRPPAEAIADSAVVA